MKNLFKIGVICMICLSLTEQSQINGLSKIKWNTVNLIKFNFIIENF